MRKNSIESPPLPSLFALLYSQLSTMFTPSSPLPQLAEEWSGEHSEIALNADNSVNPSADNMTAPVRAGAFVDWHAELELNVHYR